MIPRSPTRNHLMDPAPRKPRSNQV
jgi:hypothetical protein